MKWFFSGILVMLAWSCSNDGPKKKDHPSPYESITDSGTINQDSLPIADSSARTLTH
jgi:hypothetical protein